MKQVRLVREWMGNPSGAVVQVSELIGKQLVRDKFAEWVDTPSAPSAAPKARKILRPEVVK